MWNLNLYMKNFNLFFSKPKPPSPHCYLASNPISSADDGDDHYLSSSSVALASGRFFFSSPGRSKSIVDSPDASCCPRRGRRCRDVLSSEGVRVAKYSVDPYGDFRRSMEEMIEGREMEKNEDDDDDVRRDWEYLRELLWSYLRLNRKDTHKFIITAFADLLLSLLATSSSPPITPTLPS